MVKLWPGWGFEWQTDLISVFSNVEPFLCDLLCMSRKTSWFLLWCWIQDCSEHAQNFFKIFLFYAIRISYFSTITYPITWHGLYNAFFSAFYSKQLNKMIYFYLCVFGRNNSNPSFHEKQLLTIAACSGFGWMFSMHWQAVYNWKLSGKKKTKKKPIVKILIDPSENHTFCVESTVFPINQSKNWINSLSLRSFFSDHTAYKKPR